MVRRQQTGAAASSPSTSTAPMAAPSITASSNRSPTSLTSRCGRARVAGHGQQRGRRRSVHCVCERVHWQMSPILQGRRLAALLATLVMFASVLFYTYGRALSARSVPEQLTDREFWQLVEEFSE